MPSKQTTSSNLNEQRRRAVQLRLAGKTLAEVRSEVGLSTPTIVAAVKAFKTGGWAAVDVKPRGRPRRDDSGTTPTEQARSALLSEFYNTQDALWTTNLVCDWLKRNQKLDVSLQTVASYLQSWYWLPENQHKISADSASTAIQTWRSGDYADFKTTAKQAKATLLWLGIQTVESEFTQLFCHTLRGRCLWMCFKDSPTREQYQQFFAHLITHFPNGIALVAPNKLLEKEVQLYANTANVPVLCSLAPSSVVSTRDRIATKKTNKSKANTNKKTDDVSSANVANIASAQAPTGPATKTRSNVPESTAQAPSYVKTTASLSATSKKRQVATRSVRVPSTSANTPTNAPAKSPLTSANSTNLKLDNKLNYKESEAVKGPTMNQPAQNSSDTATDTEQTSASSLSPATLSHLQRLEAESIQILREVAAEAENPVMMYSIGKDSAVMLHLARKAFFPAKPPFPLLHVDTTWKFQDMYRFRDEVVKEYGFELLTHTNPEGLEKGVNPFTHGSALHTDIMKTEALKQALDKHGFDVAIGGARRDEEKSRAKERVFSFRTAQHRWEPKNQRPELWNLYNTRKQPGESIRAFPISNWTELDIWQYIHQQNIPIVPLYFAAERPVVERDGTLIMVDDDRMPLNDGEVPMMRSVRFRTLGCYPLTGAVESTATTLLDIIQETLLATNSERQGRMIDTDTAASMEKKKQQGYF